MTSLIVALALLIIPFDCGFAGSDKIYLTLFLSKKSTNNFLKILNDYHPLKL
jgi:hypothetical protein